MSAAMRQGVFPHLPILRLLVLGGVLLAACLWLAPARADVLYRCTGSRGEQVFSSTTQGYTGCRRLTVDTSRRAASAVRPVQAPATAGKAAAKATPVPPPPPAKAAATGQGANRSATAAGQWQYRDSQNRSLTAAADSTGAKVLRGAVYRVVHADGSVEYTNLKPPHAGGRVVTRLFSYIATCAACNLHSTIDWKHVRLNLTAYGRAIRGASREFGVDPAFLRAIIHAESAFNPRALSLKGAQGLMQLMPGTASDMGVLDAFDAEQNIRGGARYLARLLDTFHGDEQLAAAAYNAGPGAVQRYGGVPPYDETRVYVQRVGVLRKRYAQARVAPLADAAATTTPLPATRGGGH